MATRSPQHPREVSRLSDLVAFRSLGSLSPRIRATAHAVNRVLPVSKFPVRVLCDLLRRHLATKNSGEATELGEDCASQLVDRASSDATEAGSLDKEATEHWNICGALNRLR